MRLVVSDLRKSFASPNGERIEVLRGVSFIVEPGETVAITGASGAGKSTLLHLIGGLETPDHGSIVLGEFPVHRADSDQLSEFHRRRTGFIFQFHHLLEDLTAAENVAMPLLIDRVGWREALRCATTSLEQIGLGDRASHLQGQLSGGEQQRVAVSRALINKPSLVAADEPTGNLDAAIGDDIGRSLIAYARGFDAIVLIATHNDRLARMCDRSLVLEEGRLHQPVIV